MLKENKKDFSIINNLFHELGKIYENEYNIFKDLINESVSNYIQIKDYLKEIIEKNKFLKISKCNIF